MLMSMISGTAQAGAKFISENYPTHHLTGLEDYFQDGWDGEDCLGIDALTFFKAVIFFDDPMFRNLVKGEGRFKKGSAAPGPNGSIDVVWDIGDRKSPYLYLRFTRTGMIHYYYQLDDIKEEHIISDVYLVKDTIKKVVEAFRKLQ